MKIYSDESSKLSDAIIDDEMLLAMGRIVRSIAEVENLVIFYFMALTNFTESQAIAALRGNSISANIQRCADLAKLKGQKFKDAHDATFDDTWRSLLFVRNVIAHSRLLGKTDEGEFAFLILRDPIFFEESSSLFNVICYPLDAFQEWAKSAESVAPTMINNQQLAPILKANRRLALGPHPKATKKKLAK